MSGYRFGEIGGCCIEKSLKPVQDKFDCRAPLWFEHALCKVPTSAHVINWKTNDHTEKVK